MTSDAKIGLLLGLVFIFVIAFIINGLPNFGDHAKAETPPMMVTETDSIGVTGNAQKAQKQLDWDGLINAKGDDLTVIPETASDPESTVVPVTPDDALTDQDVTAADDGEIRSFRTLDDLVGGMSGKIQKVVQSLIEPTPGEQTSTEPAPVIASTESEPAPSQPVSPIVEQLTTPEPKETPKPAPTTKPGTTAKPPKIYVVEEGDVLATVAKKAYGPEEGNRLVNIDRIFKANKDTLETPDKIVVGQKLIIPPLPAAEKADAQFSKALFEKVEKIGKRNVADVKDSGPKSSGRLYVVQDGDSLWKIASSELGSGARWEELVKLNADQLKSEDATLVIGMKLKLPAK